ncbi:MULTISPECIES: ubiquinol oxidase subunit II [Halomonadaceae]|uniref:Ubiquinol oxidase subunit 2 n=2 Tax=Vreelandella titanicae TaxID=664683 RepID=A0A558JAQ9_9GAMM|nr:MULTISPECIES: ubiquinol oxidase subunit II [Halomonas]MBR9904620.1 ubiquinol oxidase subunit II [Gammaproteobacteria bacterium]ELY21549.1 Bo-type ubiquinol oxidase, subunit II [Halomonas titanicae BH1]MCE7516845.1 ubiquinol oxidase subunit II [Halomonas titanicae]NVE90871.1 ubiquinol oxidase subunit II [Halomonas titanicae]QKS22318.1 Cytochrome bo(3) ubiquinol oxidase subunit 2 [Halomonas titanicae]
MQRRSLWRRRGTLVLLALCLFLAGCSSALLDPKGQIGAEQRTLILTAFGLMLIVVIPVIVMTLLFGWRYRRSNSLAKYTPDWAHSNVIEAVVWIVPCAIIAVLALLTWKTSHSLDPHKPLESDVAPIEIQAVALDWKWLFIYPEQGIASVNEVAFPVDTPVRFRVSSGSVMNAFFIPHLGSQIYAMAGMDNDVHLIADEIGSYPGRSTNYSGAGFSGMTFEAKVTNPEDFDAWVETVRAAPQTLTYPEGYEALAEPSESNPVEYFSAISPSLYESILRSFHTGGEHQMGGDHADSHDGENEKTADHAAESGHVTNNHASQDNAMRSHSSSVEVGG